MELNKHIYMVSLFASFLLHYTVGVQAGTADTRGGIKIQSEGYEFSLNGFLQWDMDYFDGLHNNGSIGSESKLRRARLIFKGKLPDNIQYNLMSNYNTGKKQVEFLNAFVNYSGLNAFDIKIGRFKEPFGMEALSSAKWLYSIERSFVFSKPSPIVAGLFPDTGGVMLHNKSKNYTWAIGVFDDGAENSAGRDSYALTGRVTWAPIHDQQQLLHLGVAWSDRNPKADSNFELNYPLGINSAAGQSLFSTTIDGLTQSDIEIAYQNGAFSMQSEWISSRADGDNAGVDIDFDNYYIVLAYVLNGYKRQYKKGVFGGVKGKKAFELILKQEHIEADISGAATVEADIFTAGFNYYINKHSKLALNYVDTSTENVGTLDSGDGLALRYQLGF